MTVREAVESGDLDRLVRLVDGLCVSRDWDGVVELRDRCRHRWAELSPYVAAGPARALCAHERVVRGEDLTGDDTIDHAVIDLPLVLALWEHAYMVAEYKSAEATFPTPRRPDLERVDLPAPGEVISDDEVLDTLTALAAPWAEQSNGTVAVAAGSGPAEAAIAAIAGSQALVAEVDAATAMAWMAWTGASGGAYGRRRGTPMGRFGAWWAASAITGLEWPPDPSALVGHLEQVRWLLWEPVGTPPGWSGSIAAERGGRSWALFAVDRHREAIEPDSPTAGPVEPSA
jgi:hypothetical protein